MPVKAFRSLFAVILSCLISWNIIATPAFAASDPFDSLINGFWQGLGGLLGGASGTLVTCYAVDILIAPIAPPVAAYLAPMCSAIGGAAGGASGFAGARAISGSH
jgi:hypothetical protein